MDTYVVVLQRRHESPAVKVHHRAEVVEARTADEAVEISLEGNSWETEDGRYNVHVALLSSLEKRVAVRSTDTTVTVREADSRDA